MYEVAFTIFGILLALIPSWLNRKRRLRTHWCALRAEMSLCKEKLDNLLNDDIQSPLYRLPLIAYQISYPVLLADGAVSEEEVLILGRFFGLVQDINRGLDNTAAMHMSAAPMVIEIASEFNRNLMKAGSLVKKRDGKASLFDQAKEVFDRKIALKWWQYGKYA
jgi:hypothetical protein